MEEEKFSDDPIQHLKIENEILRMQLKAQYGDAFFMQTDADMPPEIENQFLKNMMAFEAAHANSDTTTVYKKIGEPPFKPVAELKTEEISNALKTVTIAMEEHGIFLDIINGPYPDELIYKFITEELFNHEIDSTPLFEGGWHFIYEEFYPDNRADIERNTHDFLRHWFQHDLDENCSELGYDFITADGRQLKRKDFFSIIQPFFESFTQLQNDAYNIDDIQFTLNDDGSGMGHAEGVLKYDAVMENGEVLHFEGPYKLYMSREDKWWTIFYFVMPGFKW